MASSARKTKTNPSSDSQLQLLYADDAISKYWSSSLFNTVYLRHDISDKHSCWKNDDDLDFQNFMNTLRNISVEYKNRDKELSNWSETETINNWVKHVLHALGWTNNCSGVQNPFLEETSFRYDGKTYRTDILIVDHPKEKQYVNQAKGDDKLKEARQSILMPVEVKYWQRLEEYRQGKNEEKDRTDNECDDIARTATPNEQTVQYMEILKKSWGILTDGAKWRLFNTELSAEDAERYYEFNFSVLFQSINTEETEADSIEILEAAKYFYYFFSKFAFYPKNESERPFVDEVLQYSKKYVNKVEEDLKERFVKAMNIACNSFFEAAKSAEITQDLAAIRNVSESTLFNILFIKSLESRGVLPMASTDYKKISLTSIIDKIERFDPEKEEVLNSRELGRAFKKGNGNSFDYHPEGAELHDRILRLTGVIHKGASAKDNFGFEITGFRESIFSDSEWLIFKSCKINNQDWVRILFELGYAESESMNRKYQQIPYAYFTPRQLGSIYESFLEFKLDKATENMVFEKRQWKAVDLKSQKYRFADLPKVEKGQLFFTPDNRDRKASGSYYTPDQMVQLVVEKTLGPLVQNCSTENLVKLKICDPTMGSGHFLSGALKYLTTVYLEKVNSESIGSDSINSIKCKILEKCIYGYDINPRAVKLAKMSLWLETAAANRKLEDLNDQLLCQDSLIPWTNEYKSGFKDEAAFDAVVGNPPWDKIRFDEEEFFKQFSDELNSKKVTKTKKQEIFKKLLTNKSIKDKFEFEKSIVEKKISAIESSYYKFQKNEAEKQSRFIDHNLYKLAIERFFRMLSSKGRIGVVLPTGVLGDLGCSNLRKFMFEQNVIETIVGFAKDAKLFEISQAVSLIIGSSGDQTEAFKYIDFLEKEDFGAIPSLLNTAPKVKWSLVQKFDPDTLTVPFIKNSVSLGLVEKLYQIANPPSNLRLEMGRELHQTDDSKYLSESARKIRVFKGDEIEHFFSRPKGKQFLNAEGEKHHKDKVSDSPKLAIRAISGLSDPRRLVAAIIPPGAVTVNSLLIAKENLSEDEMYYAVALLNSRAIEYRFRQISKNNNVNKFALDMLPLPKYSGRKEQKHIVNLCRKFLNGVSSSAEEIDRSVMDLFGLTESEKEFLINEIPSIKADRPVSKKRAA